MHFLQVHQECVLRKLDMWLQTLESSGVGPTGLYCLPPCMVATEVSNSTIPLQTHLHICITTPGIVNDLLEASACNGTHQLQHR